MSRLRPEFPTLFGGLLVLFSAVSLAACMGDDGDGDGGGGGSGSYEGTWVQVGCANTDCEDVDCMAGWEAFKRKIEFHDGGSAAWMSFEGETQVSDAEVKGDTLCPPQVGCFELVMCGEHLLYCLAPQLCEKLELVD